MKKNIILFVFLGVALVVIAPVIVPADNQADINKSLVQYAQESYRKGNIDLSIDYFSRALLVDLNNEEVFQMLAEIAYKSQVTPERRKDLDNLQLLYEQRYRLKENLALISERYGWLKDSNKITSDMRFSLDKIVQKREGILNQRLSEREEIRDKIKEPLKALNEELEVSKIKLSLRIDEIEQLIRLTHKLVKESEETQLIVKKADRPLEQTAREVPSAATERLKHEIINLTLKVSENKDLLEKSGKQLLLANESLLDYKSRFELGQRLLREKDKVILALQGNMDRMQKNLSEWRIGFYDEVDSKNLKLSELNGIVKIYRSKLEDISEEVEYKNEDIARLNTRLNVVKQELFDKDRELQRTKRSLVLLQDKLAAIEQGLFELKLRSIRQNEDEKLPSSDLENLKEEIDNMHKFISKQLLTLSKIDG